jgi:penicillin-binding protein 1A
MNEPLESSGFFDRYVKPYLPKKPWALALVGLFGLLATGVLTLAIVALALAPTLPSIDELSEKRLKVPMRVYTAEGDLIAEFGEEKRVPVRIDEVPDQMIKAILAAEDHSFFYHHGVDYTGILRAALHNLRTKTSGQGASTITMQVARNYFLSPEKTYTRKIKEILLAYKLERELSKKQILELYINKIYLGQRAYGFAAAAQIYYGKNLTELNLQEMAMLAGMPKAPSKNNPLTNPDAALDRRNYVLKHMYSLGYIDEPTAAAAVATVETASKRPLRFHVDAPHIAEMARQAMIEKYDENTYANGFHVYTTLRTAHQRAANLALRKWLLEYERRHGYRGAAGHVTLRGEVDRDKLDEVLKDYRTVGHLVPAVVLKVEDKTASLYTQDGERVDLPWKGIYWARRYVDENTLGPALANAGDALGRGDIVYAEYVDPAPPDPKKEKEVDEGDYWRLAQVPQVAGAFVSLSSKDGAILALTGGFDFYHSNFNRVMQAERQPGSSIKPFIYTAALDKGFTAATTLSGAPIVTQDAQMEDEWRPEDYSKKFYGPTRLRKALALSLNLVSVRLLRATGARYTAEYMERFGFDSKQLPKELSLALGSASATPMQMANAYLVFASGGYKLEPYFIQRVEDTEHKVLEQANPPITCEQRKKTAAPADGDADTAAPRIAERVLSPEVNYVITSMMRDVIRSGTGHAAMQLGRRDLAGKTGTTNDYRDAWFSGFNSEIAATAWVGFDQPASLGRGEAGGRAALPIWIDYMRVALEGVPEKPLAMPEDVVKTTVHSETGLPVSENDPNAIEEYFVKGTENQTQGPTGEETTETKSAAGAPEGTPPPAPTGNVRENLF